MEEAGALAGDGGAGYYDSDAKQAFTGVVFFESKL